MRPFSRLSFRKKTKSAKPNLNLMPRLAALLVLFMITVRCDMFWINVLVAIRLRC